MIADVRFPIFVGLSPNQCSLYARATSFSVPTAGSPPTVRLSRPGRLLFSSSCSWSLAASALSKLSCRTPRDVPAHHKVVPYALQVWFPHGVLSGVPVFAAAVVLAVAGEPGQPRVPTPGGDRNRHRTHERETSISREPPVSCAATSDPPVRCRTTDKQRLPVGKRGFYRLLDGSRPLSDTHRSRSRFRQQRVLLQAAPEHTLGVPASIAQASTMPSGIFTSTWIHT